jgi:hypothetical protein
MVPPPSRGRGLKSDFIAGFMTFFKRKQRMACGAGDFSRRGCSQKSALNTKDGMFKCTTRERIPGQDNLSRPIRAAPRAPVR